MSSDDEKKEEDAAKSSLIPEVDAEVVEEGKDAGAEPFDEPDAAADESPPRRSLVSPGVLVFGGLVIIAVAAGLYWYFAVDKGVIANPAGSAIEAPQNTAPDGADAPDEKIANTDMAADELKTPIASENETTLADAMSELETPADSIANADIVEDAKTAAVSEGEFAAAPKDDDDNAPSFDLEGEGAEASNQQLAEVEGSAAQPGREAAGMQSTDEVPTPDNSGVAALPDETIDDISTDTTSETVASAAINDLETALAAERQRAVQRSDELETTRSRLAETLAALKEATSDLAQARAAIRTLRAENDRLKKTRETAPLAEAAIALNAIEKAAAAGENYDVALARLKSAAPDIRLGGVLADHAGGGAPTLRELQAEFDAAARAGLAAANRENANSVVDRYGARISGLFNIRPAAPQAGDAPSAVISRAEDAVYKGVLSMAIEEIAALPPAARDEMKPWTNRAETRIAIDEALTALNAEIAAKATQAATL